jgi:hypothetical protein
MTINMPESSLKTKLDAMDEGIPFNRVLFSRSSETQKTVTCINLRSDFIVQLLLRIIVTPWTA